MHVDRARAWAWTQVIQPPARKLVLVAICDLLDEQAHYTGTLAEIGAWCGLEPRGVRLHVDLLESPVHRGEPSRLVTRRSGRDGLDFTLPADVLESLSGTTMPLTKDKWHGGATYKGAVIGMSGTVMPLSDAVPSESPPTPTSSSRTVEGATAAVPASGRHLPADPATPVPAGEFDGPKSAAVVREIKAAGVTTVWLTDKDHCAIAGTDLSPAEIAQAFAAMVAREWGDKYLWDRGSVGLAIKQYPKYEAATGRYRRPAPKTPPAPEPGGPEEEPVLVLAVDPVDPPAGTPWGDVAAVLRSEITGATYAAWVRPAQVVNEAPGVVRLSMHQMAASRWSRPPIKGALALATERTGVVVEIETQEPAPEPPPPVSYRSASSPGSAPADA